MDAIDRSLGNLGTEYVDLYQIHRWDYATPIEETMETLHDVVKSGKTRYIGASSMYYEESDFEVLDRVLSLADQLKAMPAQIALAWLLHRPGITAPIIGASKMQHLEQAAAAIDLKLFAAGDRFH